MAGLRPWLNSRCAFVALLLVVAPGAALAHLLWTWAPAQVAVAQLQQDIAQQSRAIDDGRLQADALRARCAQLEQSRRARDSSVAPWLPQRDRDGVFDRVAEAFRDPQVAIERLMLDEPTLYAAATRSKLLACENVVLDCTGSYTGLAGCLDRLAALETPLQIVRLVWAVDGQILRLSLNLRVPFVPPAELHDRLVEGVQLTESNPSRARQEADEQEPHESE